MIRFFTTKKEKMDVLNSTVEMILGNTMNKDSNHMNHHMDHSAHSSNIFQDVSLTSTTMQMQKSNNPHEHHQMINSNDNINHNVN